MAIDPAILLLLPAHSTASLQSLGGGFSSTAKLTATLEDGSKASYFLKTGPGDDAALMFAGEHASLQALSSIPNLAPRSLGYGIVEDGSDKHFLLTEWLEMSNDRGTTGTLAEKLARLHTTPAPIPDGYTSPQYGFPVPTCCGSTPQRNDYCSSWADFFANNRLRFIMTRSRASNGGDRTLEELIERTCQEVVPALLSNLEITPVVVHGDLWSGNASVGELPGMSEAQHVIYDSSACYAHSEYELGIMRMFGSFPNSFWRDYHQLVSKTEPTTEYDDRVSLYELYHHLNHYAMFGGSYKAGAVNIMRRLLSRYGRSSE